jgi:hypothetical protein
MERKMALQRTRQWLQVSGQILQVEPDRLQRQLLQISKKRPALSCYAAELAQLRMISPEMEQALLTMLTAKSEHSVDRITDRICREQPVHRALLFLAGLMKQGLAEKKASTH